MANYKYYSAYQDEDTLLAQYRRQQQQQLEQQQEQARRQQELQQQQQQQAQLEQQQMQQKYQQQLEQQQKQQQEQMRQMQQKNDAKVQALEQQNKDANAKLNTLTANNYTGLQGVNLKTAQQLGNAQQGYQPSAAVQQAEQALQSIQSQKPQGYTSKYKDALDNIMQQIQNPGEFKYEFNGDNLFKNYADLYTQKGKQASMDAMGQAAGLTGGYGNSYAQMVGQQQYQQYLLPLYDKGLELRNAAYQEYRDRLGDKYNQYNLLANADATDYDRYRDTVGDWRNDLQYATDQARYMDETEYNRYMNNLDYWTGLAQVENADYRSEQERQEAIRQYEQNFAEQQRQYDTSMGENQRQYDTSMEENKRQYDTSMEENKRQADLDEAYRRDTLAASEAQDARDYAFKIVTATLANGQMPSAEQLTTAGMTEEDAQKLIAQIQETGKSGGGGGKKTYVKVADGLYVYSDKNGKVHQVSEEQVAKENAYVNDQSYLLPDAVTKGIAAGSTTAVNKKKNG